MASPASLPPASAAAAAGGAHNVFVYGTLMADEVNAAICSHRFSVKGRVYPAILPIDRKEVAGKVFKGVTDMELNALDIFEDEEYVRRTVEISLTDTSETLPAYAYIWGDEDDPDLYGEWDFEEWKKVHLKDYLTMTLDFMEELEQPELKTRD